MICVISYLDFSREPNAVVPPVLPDLGVLEVNDLLPSEGVLTGVSWTRRRKCSLFMMDDFFILFYFILGKW